jgi:uncharacterized protein YqjF (DUF2071 family)
MSRRRWLEMTWRDALFCHWPVDPAVVAETLPDRLSVATHDGDAYLGVVAFVMDDIRPRGAPIGLSFPELNLRTYVQGPAGPGIYFYNLDADDRLGVSIARQLFALPYYRAEMRARHTEGDAVEFRSRRTHRGVPSARFDATYRPTGEGFTAEPGSLEALLVENYRFYADGNRLYHGEVGHDPWMLHEGSADIRENTLFEVNGFERPAGEPIVHCADPLDVTADRIRRA